MFTCLGQGDNLTWECMNNVVIWIGADALAVSDCLHYSWKESLNNQTENALYHEDKVLAELYGVSVHPSLTINGQIYKGDLTGEDILRAICASFSGTNRPEECKVEFVVRPPRQKTIADTLRETYCNSMKDIKWKPLHCTHKFGNDQLADAAIDFVAPKTTYSRSRMWTVILVVVLVNLVIAYFYRRH